MSTNDDGIIDAEIVDDDRLPAVIERASNSEPIELPNRQDSLLAGNPDRRCVATNSRGERCRKFAIYGATVCRTHGGATKKVKEAARIRVENASNRLMGKLIEFAFDDTKPPDVQLKAIQNSLDRAGLKPPAEVVLSQGETKPYEQVFDSIGGTPPGESLDTNIGNGAASHIAESSPQGDFSAPSQPPPTHTQPTPKPQPARENPGWPEGQDGGQSSHGGPLEQADSHQDDRERDAQPRHEARSRRTDHDGPRPPARTLHITGDAAMHVAAELTREQRAIESPHKRYPRP
ncbi:hypothetical protein [Mycobacterium sp. 141]|uniref:hypothetical protein n=1 Tax=Mycobacterium sp. 141 TaxID=1120797 RepID=UPI00036455C3|nr:hypothetical protein [Mycobacterium sp. 141]